MLQPSCSLSQVRSALAVWSPKTSARLGVMKANGIRVWTALDNSADARCTICIFFAEGRILNGHPACVPDAVNAGASPLNAGQVQSRKCSSGIDECTVRMHKPHSIVLHRLRPNQACTPFARNAVCLRHKVMNHDAVSHSCSDHAKQHDEGKPQRIGTRVGL